jgi:hypothetical protein
MKDAGCRMQAKVYPFHPSSFRLQLRDIFPPFLVTLGTISFIRPQVSLSRTRTKVPRTCSQAGRPGG